VPDTKCGGRCRRHVFEFLERLSHSTKVVTAS
jgi:hypothetical protein